MNKEMLDILNDLSKKPTTGLALQIMELSTENLILEKQVKEQKEVIDRILNETKETRNILNNNRDDNMLSKSCLLSYLEIVEDLLKEVK